MALAKGEEVRGMKKLTSIAAGSALVLGGIGSASAGVMARADTELWHYYDFEDFNENLQEVVGDNTTTPPNISFNNDGEYSLSLQQGEGVMITLPCRLDECPLVHARPPLRRNLGGCATGYGDRQARIVPSARSWSLRRIVRSAEPPCAGCYTTTGNDHW